jgi:hypothetical protein
MGDAGYTPGAIVFFVAWAGISILVGLGMLVIHWWRTRR